MKQETCAKTSEVDLSPEIKVQSNFKNFQLKIQSLTNSKQNIEKPRPVQKDKLLFHSFNNMTQLQSRGGSVA